MDAIPVPSRKRRLYERLIRLVDMIVYLVVFAGGCFAFIATPQSIIDELFAAPALITVWGCFLVGGGLIGFFARLTRRWILETPATVAALGGIAIYFVVLWNFVFSGATAAVATALAFVAGAFMVRRWLELQIYGVEPNRLLKDRIAAAVQRKTQNVVPRDS